MLVLDALFSTWGLRCGYINILFPDGLALQRLMRPREDMIAIMSGLAVVS